MTLYGGETVQVRHQVKSYDGTRLTSAEISTTISIWDRDGTTVLVDEVPMEYSDTLVFEDGSVGGWHYPWETPTVAGAYLARCTASGVGVNAWEFKTIRLRQSKRSPRATRSPVTRLGLADSIVVT